MSTLARKDARAEHPQCRSTPLLFQRVRVAGISSGAEICAVVLVFGTRGYAVVEVGFENTGLDY